MRRGPAGSGRPPAPPAGTPRDVRLSLAGFDDGPSSGTPRTVKLCLLGFGNVARALCELLAAQERVLADRHGLRFLISAAGTRRGSLVEPAGLAPAEVLVAAGCSGLLPDPPQPPAELLARSGADILVELTVMGDLSRVGVDTPSFRPPATDHVLEAFALGMDVVTANKGPFAWTWPEIATAAQRSGRRVRFESTVMDGLPVFSLLELTLPDCTLLGFEAVFNATTNFIIDAMGTGRTYDDALAEVQAEGYAEADPSNDVDGWDAASKMCALANVAMHADISPVDVDRDSLRDIPLERMRRARDAGHRLRLVSRVWREPPTTRDAAIDEAAAAGPVRASLRAEELDIEHPLAAVGGESLGALLHTDLMADVFVSERHALVPQTAYGVYADLLQLCGTT